MPKFDGMSPQEAEAAAEEFWRQYGSLLCPTPQQAEAHPQKNQLIAALGIEGDVEPHTAPDPVALEEGDAFLLCSDGWWGSLDERCIVGTLADAATPGDWLDSMRQCIEARAAPRQDNFSAIGVWVGDPPQARRR